MTPPDYPQPVLAPPAQAPVAKTGVVRASSDADLFKRTLRMIAMLVIACVVFVGALSVVAVTITSRAVGTGAKAAAEHTADDSSTKKPLSI